LPRVEMAMWAKSESGVAPCQCFSPAGMTTKSPGPILISSLSVAMMPTPAVT